MSKKGNEPAFPCEGPFNSVVKNTVFAYPGVTVRDFFAVHALSGLMANSDGPIQHNEITGWGYTNCQPEDVAREAYILADAMLSAREA